MAKDNGKVAAALDIFQKWGLSMASFAKTNPKLLAATLAMIWLIIVKHTTTVT
jgi:hypothetical protein